MAELAIIIPTMDEEFLIQKTLDDLYYVLSISKLDFSVILIDDSSDKTLKILSALRKKHKKIVILKGGNSGIGSAIRLALQRSKPKYAIICMADFTKDDFIHIPEILALLKKGYDIVQTSRFEKSSRISGYPMIKYIANRLCNNFIRLLFKRKELKDFTSLYKGFRTERINRLEITAKNFDIGLELVLKSIRKGYRIIEIPVNWKQRSSGRSKFNILANGYFNLQQVIRIWLYYK